MQLSFYKLTTSLAVIVSLTFTSIILVGCASGGGPTGEQQLADLRNTVVETKAATTQAIADAQKEINTYPPSDPVRKTLEDKLAKLQAQLTKADEYLAKFDKAVLAVQAGDSAALRDLAQSIPYGGLALSIGGLVWSIYKKQEAKRALEQVVVGVETIMPKKTPAQKLLLASIQDDKTRMMVDEVKASGKVEQTVIAANLRKKAESEELAQAQEEPPAGE